MEKVVLTALESIDKIYAKPLKEVTPFQHWLNKNMINLKEKYMEEFDEGEEYKDGFIKWCKEQYGKK